MISFITLITALCFQPSVGHGSNSLGQSNILRQEAFAAQSACTKRLFKACTERHTNMKHLVPKEASCLVENL